MADAREFVFTNNATAALAADVGTGDTSIEVASGKGTLFPSPIPGQLCKITVQNVVTGASEIMNCVARSGDVLFVERGVEGTTASVFTAATAIVQHRITAETLEKLHESGGVGGGGGAAEDAPYLTYASTTALTSEKVLIAEATVLSLTDLGSQLQITVANNGITDEKIRTSAGVSVLGRAANTNGNVADITAVDDGGVLRRDGTSIGFGPVLQSSVTGLVAALSTIETNVAALDASTTAALATKADAAIQIDTQYSLTGGGTIASNRTLNLVGDIENPGVEMYYGTNADGTRGWYGLTFGITDHGGLSGLTDDDHTQYHNDTRGDARYPLLTRTLNTIHSLSGGGDLSADRSFSLVGDVSLPGNSMYYGTNGSGTRGWYALPSAGAVDHGALTGLSDDDHTQYHTDARGDARYPPLARQVATSNSLTGGGTLASNRTLTLVGDVASPGNSMYYGTNGSGTRGWYAVVSGGVSDHGALTGLTDDDHTQYHNDARGDARYPLQTRSVSTQHSLTGGGDLSANRTLSLVGDVASPGNNMVYATNSSGVRGWLANNAHTHSAADVTSGVFNVARLGLGTGTNLNYLRGDGAWATPVTFLTGTPGMVNVSSANGPVTLSLPQFINTTSSVQFGSLGIGTAASGTSGEIRATGNVTSFYTSDIRLKHNIKPIENAIDKVKKLRGVNFEWTNEFIRTHGGEDGFFVRRKDIGVIAQEVEAIFPEIVAERSDGFKGVKYDRLVAVLIEAVKELAQRVPEVQR
jgi:hypothetical protein